MRANFELHHDTEQYDEVGQIMAYESDQLGDAASIELFQRLLDSGLVWQLQGHYGRTAQRLLDLGLIVKRK